MEEIVCNNEGPDQVLPADDFKTTKLDGLVKLRIPETGTAIEKQPPISVIGLLERTAANHPNKVALNKKVDGHWKSTTYSEYLDQVRICAKGFLKLGLERHHGVGIIGFNGPEWFISDLGAIFAGGIAAGIYTTNGADACYHCLSISRANIVVVEDDFQLTKILKIRDQLPNLKAIVQYCGEPSNPSVAYSWAQLMELGKNEPDDNLEQIRKNIAPNECCTLVFTSGTVGTPKAVMLSHDNLIWDALALSERIQLQVGSETIVSYLPLSHVAAQVVDIFITMLVVAEVSFADKDALKGSLVDSLKEIQPTRFLGVPRVWEKIREKMLQVAKQNGSLKTAIATWAKSQALHHHLAAMKGNSSHGWGYTVASALIFKKIKQALGFTRCLNFYTAAAPLSPEIKKYFMSLDMPILDVFGMSEASGGHTICVNHCNCVDTIGKTLPGAKTKIYKPDELNRGEVCLYGRHVFMGYLDDTEKTNEALDDEGWLHSGDIGYVDESDFVYITGRSKEILITAGGENVAPVPIEDLLKHNLPHISTAMVIGDKKKFLSVLITLKMEVDDSGSPKRELTKEVQEWLHDLGCPASTIDEVIAAGPHANLKQAIQKAIDKTNEKAISNATRIQKFRILNVEFSINTGEFGPTLKLKRNVVASKFSKEIEELYN